MNDHMKLFFYAVVGGFEEQQKKRKCHASFSRISTTGIQMTHENIYPRCSVSYGAKNLTTELDDSQN